MGVDQWAKKEREAKRTVEEVCNAGWMQLKKSRLEIDSEVFERYLVVHCGGVGILPITSKGQVILERQYRHPFDEILLEIPAGRLDPNEPPEVAARRELREEIGFDCQVLQPLGDLLPSPGYCTEKVHLFVAKELFESPLKGDRGEVIEWIEIPLKEAFDRVMAGEIADGKTALAILKYVAMNGGESSL